MAQPHGAGFGNLEVIKSLDQAGLVLEYLAWLQSKEGRGTGTSTRNVRMAGCASSSDASSCTVPLKTGLAGSDPDTCLKKRLRGWLDHY